MPELKRYRRKVDGFVTADISEADAKGMAGFAEGEWEEAKPFVPQRNRADAPAARSSKPSAPSKPRARKGSRAKGASVPPEPAPEPAAEPVTDAS